MLTKVSGVPLELKTLDDEGRIEGYGSIFGVVDSYNEVVEPGAFKASLALAKREKRSIKMLWDHSPKEPIGIWDEAVEDDKGLRMSGRILVSEVQRAREVHAMLKAGAVDGLSIGYTVDKMTMGAADGEPWRLQKLSLMEVSVVTFPACAPARVDAVKHMIARGELPTVREFEAALRDALGFSKSLAAALAAKATPILRGEPGGDGDDGLALLRALSNRN